MDFVRYILFEGREQDFKFKYSTKFTEEQLDDIINVIRTLNNGTKFLTFLGKNLQPNFSNDTLENVKTLLKKFLAVGQNLTIRDINKYGSIEELETALKGYEDKIRRSVKEVEGADIVYEDKKYVIVTPKTHKASCYYGAGTKWCTASSSNDTHFNTYMSDGRLFYIIDKTKPTSDIFYKVALLQKFGGEQSFFDAPDNKFTTGWIFNTPVFNKLMLAIDNYMADNYSEKIKIYKDENLKKLEKERLERERLRQIRERRLQEAEERRQSNEWDLENLMSGELGACAHAVLNVLVDSHGVVERTVEDNVMLAELKREQSDLDNEYDNTDDDELKSRITDRLSIIEDEINEIDNKIDVYNIIPIGQEYDMYKFSVVGSDEINDSDEFISGDEDQTHSSAVTYLEDLIDDMGLDGFNASFVESHIDTDEIERYIRDFFESDVWDNPEIYLDETEDRTLSGEQEYEIDELKEKIKELSDEMSEMNGVLMSDEIEYGTDEYEELSERISEIEDEIYEIEEKIEEIESSPEGEFNEEKIEEVIEDKVDYYTSNYEEFFSDFIGISSLQWAKDNDAIDIQSLIDDAINADGYGTTLNRYDGSEEETYVNGRLYYVMQTE